MNSAFRIPTRVMLVALFVAVFVYVERARAAIQAFDDEGWYTWRVEAVDDSTRCCGTWSGGRLVSRGCNLDTDKAVAGCGDLAPSDEVQVYVRVERGEVTSIRAFSPSCPIETASAMRDLGRIDNADSVTRLGDYVSPLSELNDEALAAIAAHAGPEAFTYLRNTIRDQRDPDIREKALFWLVQSDTDEAFDFVESVITSR